MADNYSIVQVVKKQILQGGNLLVDGQEISVLTKPSGYFFAFRRPQSIITKALIDSVADQLAVRYEEVGASPNVTDLQYIADVTDAGQPLDTVRVYWANDAGTARGYITVRQADLGPHVTPPLIAAATGQADSVVDSIYDQYGGVV